MANCEPLETFGILVIIITGAFIAVPILRGSRDVINAWNVLLLGIISFTGLGSIDARYTEGFGWDWLNWYQPSVKEVRMYIVYTTVFLVALFASYYWNRPAKRFAQRHLKNWPELSAPLVFFVIGCVVIIIASSIFFRSITFIGPLTFNLAWITAPAGCVFAFALWDRNRLNVGWLLLFLGVFCGSVLYAMVVSGGRRPVLSMFLGPILYIYGTYGRHWSRTKLIASLAVAGFVILSVGVIYSKFRWYNNTAREKRSVAGVLDQIKNARQQGELFSVLLRGRLNYFGQSNAQMAMLTQRYIDQGLVTPIPLNSLAFIATYPIPRRIWPAKPEMFGMTVPRDAAKVDTNWGLGVSGQGFCEGGIPVLVLYAFLIALGVRIVDEPLKLQPSNPFLVFMHATILPHIAGIPRGDMGAMVKEALQGVLAAVLLGIVCRAIFGARRTSVPQAINPAMQNVRYPVMPGTRIHR
jgi:hypothetical protein